MDLDIAHKTLQYAESLGAQHAEVRLQTFSYELIKVDNGILREYSKTLKLGAGIRVLYENKLGFSASNIIDEEELRKAVEKAIASARVSGETHSIPERRAYKESLKSPRRIDPDTVDSEEKVKLVMNVNKVARDLDGIKSSITYLGIERDRRYIITSDGIEVDRDTLMTGMLQYVVAAENGRMERVHEQQSRVGGWEFIKDEDWEEFAQSLSRLAKEAVNAESPPAGKLRAIADPDLIGLILHEAFGHASEGDLVSSGASVLRGKLGSDVASPHVTIIDDGLIEGGYYVPYDDEGNKKTKTYVVEEGKLTSYLTGWAWATKLGTPVTGNGRAQDFSHSPIVRQTNFYMEGGDWSLEELIEELKEGIYLMGRGAGGGQVDTGAGTFTFSVGPSRIVEKGELGPLVRGVTVSGYILETLKGVEAVGKEVKIKTSVFGGCGKEGQMVRVGYGGPNVLIKSITVGGR